MQTTAKTVSKAAQAIASSHAATNDKHDPEDREVHNKEEIKERILTKRLQIRFLRLIHHQPFPIQVMSLNIYS
jgi:hypothetical protein